MKFNRSQGGFTLLEALIALLITAFGMLALAGMQMTLSRNAEVAKQRTEATRLAEEAIEQSRAFTHIDTTAGFAAWADLATTAAETITPDNSNTTFTRTVTVSGTSTDAMRHVRVLVSWSDRAGNGAAEGNRVSMNTVISQTDPADSGALGFPLPGNTTLKRPKNRSLNIPIPARDIGGGQSVYSLSNFAVVFNNDSGYVVKRCDAVDIDSVSSESDLDNCSDYDAYIVAGYVSMATSSMSFPSALDINETDLAARLSGDASGVECSLGNAVDQNTSTTISGYKYYLCVIPVTDQGSWSGRIHLAGMHTGTDYLVCRFQYADTAYINDNQRNVQPYANVSESLDNQNYIITTVAANASNTCPTVSGLQSVLHQNCRSNASNTNNNNANRYSSSASAGVSDCPAP